MKIIAAIFVCAFLLGIGILFLGTSGGIEKEIAGNSNVRIENGAQVVAVTAKGGYAPSNSVAKANTETVLQVTTRGTFDCSSALVIPSIGYRTNLPPSGVTNIAIPPQKSGTVLQGTCSMGMYNFAINFQ